MRVVITGGCGFLGRRVALSLLERGDVDELVLFDNAPSALPLPEDERLALLTGDIADSATVRAAIAPGTDAVYHLAAVVSGEAEADTDLGYRVNLDGTRAALEACRALGTTPRLIFASSLAVYGGRLPPDVGDDTPLRPQTSYGTQKAIGELLVNDYSRKGFLDGRALRLPTVVVRPGRPNRAASTFASSIIREPLAGKEAGCPVAVGDMVEAVRRLGGAAAYARIRWQPDPAVQQIVSGWLPALSAPRARALGFTADPDIGAVVHAFIEDDLEMQKALV